MNDKMGRRQVETKDDDTYIVKKYHEWYETNPSLTLFIAVMFVIFAVNILFAIFTGGQSFIDMMHPNHDYLFMDHFTSAAWSTDHPYTEHGVIYPALITCIYAIIGNLTIPFMSGHYDDLDKLAFAMRDTEGPMAVFILLVLAVLFATYVLYKKYVKNDMSGMQYNLLFVCLLFSYPVLWGLNCGNAIFLAILSTFAYLCYFDSEDKRWRYLSYVFLGVAAGVKIFPAIFAILTLKNQGLKEFGICVVIVSLILLVPFVFTDGNPIDLFLHSMDYSEEVPYVFGILNISDFCNHFGIDQSIGTVVKFALVAVTLLVILFDKRMDRWAEVALLCSLMMLTFSVSVPYTLTYMLIATVIFLRSNPHMDTIAMIALAAFIIILADIPAFYRLPAYIGTAKCGLMVILVICLLGKSIMNLKEDRPWAKSVVASKRH